MTEELNILKTSGKNFLERFAKNIQNYREFTSRNNERLEKAYQSFSRGGLFEQAIDKLLSDNLGEKTCDKCGDRYYYTHWRPQINNTRGNYRGFNIRKKDLESVFIIALIVGLIIWFVNKRKKKD